MTKKHWFNCSSRKNKNIKLSITRKIVKTIILLALISASVALAIYGVISSDQVILFLTGLATGVGAWKIPDLGGNL